MDIIEKVIETTATINAQRQLILDERVFPVRLREKIVADRYDRLST